MNTVWRLLAGLVDALPDPASEVKLRRQLAREAYERGQADGRREGYERAEADMARAWRAIAEPIARGGISVKELQARRWGPGGREHFADRRSEDQSPAEIIASARASWEPLGLALPGLVHLGGSAIHHHHCTDACRSYREGWYTPERVAGILAALPGNHLAAIAELKRRADDQREKRAA